MTINQRREQVISQRDRIAASGRFSTGKSSNSQQQAQQTSRWATPLFTKLLFLVLVIGTMLGALLVLNAHLTEQFLGAPKQTAGLIDRDSGQGALTPEYIENQMLRFNLRLQEEELTIPAGTDPTQRPFQINPGEPARYVAARLQQEGFVKNGRNTGRNSLDLRSSTCPCHLGDTGVGKSEQIRTGYQIRNNRCRPCGSGRMYYDQQFVSRYFLK